MKCHICDATLSESEVKYNRQAQEWEPCGVCLHIINEVFEDPIEEDEFREENQEVEIADDFSLDNLE